jgi:carboxyl-terminal processing protease
MLPVARMKFVRIFALGLLPVIALALGFQLGASYEQRVLVSERQRIEELFSLSGSGRTVTGDPEQEVDITLLWSVWRLLQQHYIAPDDLTANTMVYGAVMGLVDSIGDPYTLFMTPKDTKTFDDAMSGTLEGIGAQLDLSNGNVTVVAPIKGSPAEKAGLLAKDIIIKVNDTDTTGMHLEDVVSLIRGPKGTQVTLTVERADAPQPVIITVTRDAIHIPSVESSTVKTPKGTVGVVAVNQFGDATIAEVTKAIGSLPATMDGFVLDLRFNGGGYLDGATDLVSMFLKSGSVVTVERRGVPAETQKVTGRTLLSDTPMAVLINGGSASASEITAGALKDNKRATIVGTQSFGKGTVQEIIDLPGGSSLRVTVAKWLTPSGHDLGKTGIVPDIVIDRTAEEYRAGKDPQLDAAVTWLLEKRDVTKKTATGSTK